MPSIVDRGTDTFHPDNRSDTASRFAPFLDPDEKILWSGSPPRGLVLRLQDFSLIPFSIVWFGGVLLIALETIFSASNDDGGNSSIFAPVLLLFLAVGFYMAIGRFFVDMVARRRTGYAVTTRRALILGGLRSTKIKSMPLVPDLKVIASGTDRGSLKFGPDAKHTGRFGPNLAGSHTHPFMFERIASVQNVYRIVCDVQDKDRHD